MSWYKPWTWGDESQSAQDKRANLNQQGAAAGGFADTAQQNYGQATADSAALRDRLIRQANGEGSVAREQLRQGLQQQLATQRSFAAAAPPSAAPMAARTAAIQMGRNTAGMSGAAALADLQERKAATDALGQLLTSQRGQDVNAALGSRGNAIGGYGGVTPEGTFLDKWGNAIVGGAATVAKSDRRAKTKIEDGDEKASRVLKGLKSYKYDYKDEADGKGEQFGIMAQELESAGLKHAVIDTPRGKYVDGAKAATAGLGLVAALGRRVEKLERKKG